MNKKQYFYNLKQGIGQWLVNFLEILFYFIFLHNEKIKNFYFKLYKKKNFLRFYKKISKCDF